MYRFVKRVLDIVVATIVFIVLTPVLIPVMFALRFTGEGEVFFRQQRIGYRNQKFGIYKFATMLKNSPNMAGGAVTTRGDPRVLPLGRFLRRSKINELPQILNILRGDMTLVGARPLMQVSFDMYRPEVQEVVYQTPPGITGVASLFFRDEESLVTDCGEPPMQFYRDVIYPYKGELELWYQANKSLWLDIEILMLTAMAVPWPGSPLLDRFYARLPAAPRRLQALRLKDRGLGEERA